MFSLSLPTEEVTTSTVDTAIVSLAGDGGTEGIRIVLPETSASSSIRTTDICGIPLSSFLRDWNVSGNITVNRSFASHPSLSLDWRVSCDRADTVRSSLCPGLFKNIKGMWRISSPSIVESPRTNTVRVSLDCNGVHAPYNNPSRSPLDKPQRLKEGSYAKYLSLGTFAARAGVSYSGAITSKRIARTTSSQEFTTLRKELESRAPIVSGFVYYDNPEAVEIRRFGEGTIHTIAQDDIIGDITFSYNGAGTEVDGVKLSDELRNCQLNLDFDPDEQNNHVGITYRWEFENAENLFQCSIPEEPVGWALISPDDEVFRSPNYNFDSGGFTKSATLFVEQDGQPLRTEKWLYGYRYTSLDIYEVTGENLNIIRFPLGPSAINPLLYWGVVRHSITNYIYDLEEGYLVKATTTGYEEARLKQETDAQEAIGLYAQALQLGLNPLAPETSDVQALSLYNQAVAYTFTERLPINDTTDYSLLPFRLYYSDINVPADDPDWIEPRFYHHKQRSRTDYFVKENPESSEVLQLPPLVSGKWVKERERIHVTNTGKPERFTRRLENQNQEGESGRNALRLGTSSQNIGRPSPHTRLDRTPPPPPSSPNRYELYKNYRFWLSTPDSGSNFKQVEQSLSFPGVDDPGDGVRAASTVYSIRNSRNAVKLNMTILWRAGVEIGDRVSFREKIYIIFGITENYQIERNRLKGTISLQLGQYVNVPVSLTRRSIDSATSTGRVGYRIGG